MPKRIRARVVVQRRVVDRHAGWQGDEMLMNLPLPGLSDQSGLDGLPLRVSNEGLLRPRVARAQETNGLPSSPLPVVFSPPR
jgi:hypothetical protein